VKNALFNDAVSVQALFNLTYARRCCLKLHLNWVLPVASRSIASDLMQEAVCWDTLGAGPPLSRWWFLNWSLSLQPSIPCSQEAATGPCS